MMWPHRILGCLTSIRSNKKSIYLISKFSHWLKSSQEYQFRSSNLLRTEMFVQEGSHIYELPIIIRKTTDFNIIFDEKKNIDGILTNVHINCMQLSNAQKSKKDSDPASSKKQKFDSDASSTDILLSSDLEIIKGLDLEQICKEFEKLSSTDQFNSLLESIIHTEINSRAALQSLKKIIDLERRQYKFKKFPKFMINRQNVITQLVKLIVNSQDSEMIVEALSVLLKDRFSPSNNIYKDILTDEVLVRCVNGDFNIQQLIHITKIFSTYRDFKYKQAIDYFWTGFVIKEDDITASQLVPLFKLLVYMNQSKNIIQVLLEKKLTNNYHKLSVSQMTDILNVFQSDKQSSVVLKCTSKWANMHLTSVSKYDLLEFIESLSTAKYVNSTIEKAVEKTLMMKNMKRNDHALMAAVAVYCSTVHLRNPCIFNKVVKYLEKHANNLPATSLLEMIGTLGELNYHPENAKQFWIKFESVLDKKFLELQANEVLYTLLSCAFVNKYFPKYVNKIFSEDFLDKLHCQSDLRAVKFLRNQLYLLDTAMTIECATYNGPLLLHSNQLNPIMTDLRITQMLNKIHKHLVKLAGNKEKLSIHVTLNKLSATGLYTLDALIHKKLKSKVSVDLDFIKERNENTAILVLLPHYYCWNSAKLIGQQAMKIRHLRKLGLRVMLLDFKTLCTLQNQSDESDTVKYLNRTFDTAQEAL